MNPNNVQGPPPAGPPPQNHNDPPGINFQNPTPDLRTMEELCQPTMNGRGGPIAPINIQATNFGLKNHMIQKVQNSFQFHGLPGDDANKNLDKFLTITQTMKQNGVTNDALRLYIFTYSLTHHATACHNMLPVTQIDTFYNGLSLRHRDTINAAVGGTFMKRRPEECYDLIKNMTAHYNDLDTSAHRGESSSSNTSSSSEIAALAHQMAKMRKDMLQMYRSNQQVNFVTPSCETCGGPHSYYKCQTAGGYTQEVYATIGNYNSGGNTYQPQALQERPQGALPSNTIPNPQEEIKVITTRSGITVAGPLVPPPPPPSSSSNEVERDPEPTMDQVHISSPESTSHIPSPVVQPSPASRSSKLPKQNPHQPLIPYPSRLNKDKLQDKFDI
ncbi:hypothetical protein Tco_0753765 [Tanacetum coccineum]